MTQNNCFQMMKSIYFHLVYFSKINILNKNTNKFFSVFYFTKLVFGIKKLFLAYTIKSFLTYSIKSFLKYSIKSFSTYSKNLSKHIQQKLRKLKFLKIICREESE